MRNNYDRGFDNGYEIIDAEFKKLSPYWVYAVADRTWLGLDPVHTFVAAFKDKDDAEAFIYALRQKQKRCIVETDRQLMPDKPQLGGSHQRIRVLPWMDIDDELLAQYARDKLKHHQQHIPRTANQRYLIYLLLTRGLAKFPRPVRRILLLHHLAQQFLMMHMIVYHIFCVFVSGCKVNTFFRNYQANTIKNARKHFKKESRAAKRPCFGKEERKKVVG